MTHRATAQADGHPGVESTADRVIAEIAATLDLMAHEVIPTANIRTDFGALLHDMQQLRINLSREFHLDHIPVAVMDGWQTVGQVIAFIESRTASEAIGA